MQNHVKTGKDNTKRACSSEGKEVFRAISRSLTLSSNKLVAICNSISSFYLDETFSFI